MPIIAQFIVGAVLGVVGLFGLSAIDSSPNVPQEGLLGVDPRVFITSQGGTGTSSPSGILYGSGSSQPLKTVVIGTNLTFSGGTLSSTASGGSGSISTSSPGVVGSLLYFTTAGATPELVNPVATTTLTASSPLSLSNPVAKVGGVNSIITIDTSGAWSGTAAALAANAANCAAGSGAGGVSATGAAEDCTDYEQSLTAGDALTRTGDDFDFDGGATPSGDLGGTWASPSVTDDSHAHTSTTISGLDVSADLNLTGGLGLTLTGDDMACDTASGSVFGCLASADWTTFNNKESALTFSWPLIRTTNAISFGGLSTSSPIAAASGLLYATGVNTLASVSTSSAVSMSITGLAGTATALAANGANCTAGNYPLGVDASGAVEDCTAAAAGGGGIADPFTHASYGGQVTSATTSTLWLTNSTISLAASSSVLTYASSTAFSAVTAWFTNLFIGADTIAEYISDTAGAFFTGNTETGITVTYQDADNTVDVVCNTADTSTFGCLTDTDWDTFNGKENVLTAGDALTRTANDIDFDGGTIPAGDLDGTWAAPTVDDDSHAHTSTTVSGLDVSADLNLTAGDGLTLTDDDLDCDTASASVFGCLSAANWTAFSNKWDLASSTIGIPYGGTGTTTAPQGHLLYGGATAYQSVATTTLTASAPLSLSNPVVKVGGANSALSLDTSGTWTGNAGTATALAADGADCSAGQFPLGVSTVGAAQTCTDAWTEAENTSAAYAAQATTITVAGTANQLSSSAGAQSLAANRTWTLSLPTHVIFPSSFVAAMGSTTNATSTNLSVTGNSYLGIASSTSLIVSNLNAANCDVKSSTAGVLSCGTDANSGGGGSFPFSADTNFGAVVYSTTTPTLWFKGGMYASSTSQFDNATTTFLTVSDTAWIGRPAAGDSTVQFGWNALDSAWSIGRDDTDGSFSISSSTLLGTTPALTIAKTTLASTFAGALAATTLDTGQGANELYDMDQNVLQASSPTFAALTLTAALTAANGGTGAATLTDGGVLLGSGTGAITPMAVLADGSIIVGDGTTDPVALAAFESSTGDLAVTAGGTGVGTLTDGGLLLGNGTADLVAMSVLGDGVLVIGDNSTDPTTIQAFTSSTGLLRHEVGGLEFDASAITTGGLLRGASAGVMSILTIGTDGQVLTAQADGSVAWEDAGAGSSNWTDLGLSIHPAEADDRVSIGTTTVTSLATLTVSATSSVSTKILSLLSSANTEVASISVAGALSLGTDLTVANGGTGGSSFTGIVQGNGTSAFSVITDSSTVGQVLRVTGASTYAWGAINLDDTDAFTGTLPASAIEDSFLLNNGDIGTGAFNFGGADTFEIPNGGSPQDAFVAIGQMAWDTTNGNLVFATSTTAEAHVVLGSATTTLYAYTATTSPIIVGTTLELPPHPLAQVATYIGCKVTAGTSLVLNISDGTNDSNSVTCTTSWLHYKLSSNNSFTANERINVEYGAKTGTTGDIVVRIEGYRTSD